MSGLTRRELLASTAAAVAAAAGSPVPAASSARAVAAPVVGAVEALAGFQTTLHHTLPGLVTWGTRRWFGWTWSGWRCPPIIAVGEDAAAARLVTDAIDRVANKGPRMTVNIEAIAPVALEAWVFAAFWAAHGGILLLENIDRLPFDLDRRLGGLIAYGADVWVLGTIRRRLRSRDTVESLGRVPLMGWPLLVPAVACRDLEKAVGAEVDYALEARPY